MMRKGKIPLTLISINQAKQSQANEFGISSHKLYHTINIFVFGPTDYQTVPSGGKPYYKKTYPYLILIIISIGFAPHSMFTMGSSQSLHCHCAIMIRSFCFFVHNHQRKQKKKRPAILLAMRTNNICIRLSRKLQHWAKKSTRNRA